MDELYIPEIIYGCLTVNTNNIGDHFQIIASRNLLKKYIYQYDIYIDRDNELKNLPKNNYKNIIISLNGWFKRYKSIEDFGWTPNDKIIPIFQSFHIRLFQCPYLISENSIKYFKKWEPIGCRDIYTRDLLKNNNIITDDISNCLVLTIKNNKNNKNNKNLYKKIFITSRNMDLYNILPNHIKNNSEFINHYTHTNNNIENLKDAEKLISKYETKAKYVITTFLHSALLCLALNIPVILFYPNSFKEINKSDEERFSSISNIIKIYKFSDINNIDWNPKKINIDKLKLDIKNQFYNKIEKILFNLDIPYIIHNILSDNIYTTNYNKYKIYSWNKNNIEAFFHSYFKSYYIIYLKIKNEINKKKFLKYLILYKYGGILFNTMSYIDLIENNRKNVYLFKNITSEYLIATPPLHPIWLNIIDYIINQYIEFDNDKIYCLNKIFDDNNILHKYKNIKFIK
jgi:hypothetical protein